MQEALFITILVTGPKLELGNYGLRARSGFYITNLEENPFST